MADKGLATGRHLAIQYPKDPSKFKHYLSVDEHFKLFHELNGSKNHMLKFFKGYLLLTVARCNAAKQAQWRDFNVKITYGPLKTKSGQSQREVTAATVLETLRLVTTFYNNYAQKNPCAFVFENLKTYRLYRNLHRSWNKTRRAAGLRDFKLHNFLYIFASILANTGVSIYQFRNLFDHT